MKNKYERYEFSNKIIQLEHRTNQIFDDFKILLMVFGFYVTSKNKKAVEQMMKKKAFGNLHNIFPRSLKKNYLTSF